MFYKYKEIKNSYKKNIFRFNLRIDAVGITTFDRNIYK